jgi:hypothetical protein
MRLAVSMKMLSDAWETTLEEYREDGMTEKNLALIRLVLTAGVWSRVVDLPQQLLQQARLQRHHAPVRAAVLAQIAAAVAILTVARVRLGNLSSIRLGENLIKPGGPFSNFWLTFPKYDVKNRTPLQIKLDETVTVIINEYVHDFRPALMRGSNADWLFPGEGGKHKEKISFSTQIVKRVQKSTGLRITVHQFRHAAGVLILKRRPGEYDSGGPEGRRQAAHQVEDSRWAHAGENPCPALLKVVLELNRLAGWRSRQFGFFRRKTIRPTTADLCSLDHVTEATREFLVRR